MLKLSNPDSCTILLYLLFTVYIWKLCTVLTMAVYCKGGYSLLQAFMPVYTMTYSLRVLQIALHMNKAIESIRLKRKREGGRRFFTQIEPN